MKTLMAAYTYALISNMNVSTDCLKRPCDAINVLKAKEFLEFKITPSEGGENPTSALCRTVKGKATIGKNADGSEESVCIFPDGSYVKGWDLLNKLRSLQQSGLKSN